MSLMCGCDSQGPASEAEPVVFENNAEAVRFVRGLREAIGKAERPPNEDIKRLKSIASQYPGEAFVEELLLSLLPSLGDWDGMASYLEAKSELSDAEHSTLARVHIRQADYAGARRAAEGLLQQEPQSVEGNVLLGRACYFLGELDRSAAAYDLVWDGLLAEGRTTDLSYRAMIYFDQGEAQQALNILLGAVKAAPDSIVVLNSLGRVLASEGRLQEADGYSQRASSLQDQISQTEKDQQIRAARIFSLNRALGAQDMQGCEDLVFEYLADSDAAFREELFRFLERIYRQSGRESELPKVLERARNTAKQGRGQ